MNHYVNVVATVAKALRRSPGYLLRTSLPLSASVAAALLLFAVSYAMTSRPVGASNLERMVSVSRGAGGVPNPDLGMTLGTFEGLRFSTVGELVGVRHFRTAITASGASSVAYAEAVRGRYFSALGVSFNAGIPLELASEAPSAYPPIVISERIRRKFGLSASPTGEVVQLGDQPFVVIGVAGESFAGLMMPRVLPVDVWIRMNDASAFLGPLTSSTPVRAFGLVAREATFSAVKAELAAIAVSASTSPDDVLGAIPASAALLPTRSKPFFSTTASIAAALAGISLLAGMLGTVNTALIRGGARARELRVRWMLGASKAEIRRIVGLESLIVAGIGATLGLMLSALIGKVYPSVGLPEQNGVASVLPLTLRDQWWPYLVMGLVPVCCTAVVLASRLGTGDAREGARPHRLTGFVQGFCLASQLAVAIATGTLTVLLLKNLGSLTESPGGIALAGTAVAHVDLRLHHRSDAQGQQDLRELQIAAESIVGPGRAALVSRIPSDNVRPSQRVRTDVVPDVTGRDPLLVATISAGPAFFETVGLTLKEGRSFSAADTPSTEDVAILSNSAAGQLFGERSALQRRIQIGSNGTWLKVIGVVALDRGVPPVVFRPLSQLYRPDVLAVATAGFLSPAAFGRALQQQMPLITVFDARSLTDEVEPGLPVLRTASLVVSFLAAFGLIGSLSALLAASRQSIALRAREILIRFALGSPLRRLYVDVMRRVWIAVLSGTAVGVALVVVAQHVFREYLPGIEVRNSPMLLAVAATFCVAALTVAGIPLRLTVDENLALRLREAGRD